MVKPWACELVIPFFVHRVGLHATAVVITTHTVPKCECRHIQISRTVRTCLAVDMGLDLAYA